MVPEHRKRGPRMATRVLSILDLAEPMLGVDRSKGERGHIRIQPGGQLFITKDPNDTILFPINHDRQGHPRYNWVMQPDSVEFGFLVDGAKETVSA